MAGSVHQRRILYVGGQRSSGVLASRSVVSALVRV